MRRPKFGRRRHIGGHEILPGDGHEAAPSGQCFNGHHWTQHLGLLPGTMTAGQATYDLRRLRVRGLITRIPHSNRYTVTDDGRRAAVVLTQTHARLIRPALGAASDPLADLPELRRKLDQLLGLTEPVLTEPMAAEPVLTEPVLTEPVGPPVGWWRPCRWHH